MKNKKLFTLGLVVAAIVALTGVTIASAANFPGRGQGQNNKPQFDPANLPVDAQARFTEMQAYRDERQTDHEAIQTAVTNGDYGTWKQLMQDRLNNSPMVQTMNAVNENNFAQFTEMHNLMQAGKIDKANQIRTELGLPDRGEGMGRGFGRGMHGRDMMESANTILNN